MNHWENPRVFRESKESAHASLISYPEIAKALSDVKSFIQNPELGMYQEYPFFKYL